MEQTSLFNVLDFGDAPKQKRVHYTIPKFNKTYQEDVNTNDTLLWGRFIDVCTHLTYYFPLPLFCEVQDYYDFDKIRIWVDTYTDDCYSYRGQIFKGQNFKVTQAEIIGTENLIIQKRLYIHELLLKRLENNEKEPFVDIDTIIKELS